MMRHIRAVLDSDRLTEILGLLAGATWIDGRATAGHLSGQVKNNRQLDERDPAALAAGAIIIAALQANPTFVSAALLARIVPPLFNRYAEGEHYGPHIDGAIRPMPPQGLIRTDLSATLFLSAADAYAGGELCIRSGSEWSRVKLPAGDLVLYPANSVHHVEPVTGGERLAAFFWIESLVRDATRREMLHQLDDTIQRLMPLAPDALELVELHGHYHNLLRLWAEP